jgi:uncharacterized protein (DUF697 family)
VQRAVSTPERPAVALSAVQLLLTAVVSFAWVAVLFLPVSAQVQIGVQAAMMLVLGAIFGISIVRKKSNGGTTNGGA